MSRRHTNHRHKRKQRGRKISAVMSLLAPVLAKTVTLTLASLAIWNIGKSVSAARGRGRPKPRWYKLLRIIG